ncbi:hypothetical protein D3C76_1493310 [compost metagenome]
MHAPVSFAKTDDDLPQTSVVHVHRPFPQDAVRVDLQHIPLENMIIDHRSEQVMRRRNRMQIPGEMQVDVLRREQLSFIAARCAALHAKARAERRLPQRRNGRRPDCVQRLRQTNRG